MNEYKCKPGDIILHKERKVSVVLTKGSKPYVWKNNKGRKVNVRGQKAVISVCPIMENGQILTRSPFYISYNWEHIS
jgi:hypothetical protein